MSTPNRQSSNSNYFCHNCGTINTNGTICTQCQSEFLEQMSNNTQRQLSNDNNDQQIPLIHQFQNLFNNDFNIQTFTNMLLPMLMSQIQPNLPQHRHRRGRPPRRIKRVTYSPLAHNRYLPGSFPAIHTPISEIRLININGLNPQLFIFDSNDEMFTQLSNEDMDILPVTRNDINQLPTLTMTPSNLLINPSCAICLENFDSLSDVKQLPTCHHVFHTNCLTEWLLRHGNCPMCRTTISSIQRTPIPIFNDNWLQQLFIQTFGQQQTNIIPYPSIKTINPPQISSNTIVSDHLPSDTPQLPRFDSQTDSSSNTE